MGGAESTPADNPADETSFTATGNDTGAGTGAVAEPPALALDQVNTEVMLSQMEGLLDRVPGQAIASGIPWSKLTQDRLDLHYALNTARSTSSTTSRYTPHSLFALRKA